MSAVPIFSQTPTPVLGRVASVSHIVYRQGLCQMAVLDRRATVQLLPSVVAVGDLSRWLPHLTMPATCCH